VKELEAELGRAPGGAVARRYMAAARAEGRRDDAVLFLGELYRRTQDAGLWEAIRDLFTSPELEGLAPPEAKTAGPDQEPLLKRRPYRELVLSSFKAPFANASSIFMLVVSGPLVLGAMLAPLFLSWVGLILAIFLFGYLFGFLFDIVEQAAQGRERAPRLLTLMWSEESRFVFVAHFFRWLAAVGAACWPLLLVARHLPEWALTLAAYVLLTALFPITLLQAVYGGALEAFHYPKAVHRLRRLGPDYALCAAVFLVTNLFVGAAQAVLAGWSAGNDDRISAGRLVWGWAFMLSSMVQTRAVGLLAWARADARSI
jgi:hypothetical protein